MALYQQDQNSSSSSLLESLYCEEEEERWEDEEEEVLQDSTMMMMHSLNNTFNNGTRKNPLLFSFFPPSLLEQDLFLENDEELFSVLFSKEQEQAQVIGEPFIDSVARQEAVEWMLKVNAHYGFSALTAILAVNYLDRFISSTYYQKDKPWMIQLVAVTCLSLAAKVEETQVPLLLDLQVEETKYVFEAKTIQRMELLVLSALKWKMQPVTPLSFLDLIIRRLGLKTHLLCEFLRRCERLLLSVITDSRSVSHLPSVLATAITMHVMDQVEHFNFINCKNQLLGVLKISEEKVKGCYQLILELSKAGTMAAKKTNKRKYEPIPSSPSGVIDAVLSCDSSNGSWALGSSVSSSPKPLFKKSRNQDQWVFVDIVASPH